MTSRTRTQPRRDKLRSASPSRASVPRRTETPAARNVARASDKISLNDKARDIHRRLSKIHPDAHIELQFSNPLELLVATILSAQCTDVRVNIVTKELFRVCRTANDYASCPTARLESLIRSAGFFRSKAKSIRSAAARLVEAFGGKVPSTMEELISLPGVGRKTANVVLGNAFDVPGLPVDTHVTRVSNRLGLTRQKDPVKIETELCALLPAKHWCQFSHQLIFHGRRVCKARKPQCAECGLAPVCDAYQSGVCP